LVFLLNDCQDKCLESARIIERYAAVVVADVRRETEQKEATLELNRAAMAINALYQSNEMVRNELGQPLRETEEAYVSPRGTRGYVRTYERGHIHWTPDYGAHASQGPIDAFYCSLDGSGGRLGFPVSDELNVACSPFGTCGVGQRFEHWWDYPGEVIVQVDGVRCGASVYWSERHGTHATWGGIGIRYEQNHGTGGTLGFPISDEINATPSPFGTTGVYQEFEGGVAIYSEKFETVLVTGELVRRYLDLGGTRSWLGFPIADAVDGQQAFEGGTLKT
jgi:uncharacterized protein with LGFP repeats